VAPQASYQGFTILPSRSRGQKWIQDLQKPYKYPPQDQEKGAGKKRKKEKKLIKKLSVKV